jgi:GTPase
VTKTLVLQPYFKRQHTERTPDAALAESVGLAHAIALDVELALTIPLQSITPATYMGKGKVEELAALIEAQEIALCVLGVDTSPVQQRNLEKAFGCKVIDRTALILEIFGDRARTAEGKMQVELAALNYQKTRLVRSWTHLERQRGGFGFMGGPGESQIEIDRRLIRDRIAKINRELKEVTRTRALHRKTRRDTPYPVVALVGYTNAGKSTLFNRITGAEVYAADKLFATLDPTMRACKLPSGMTVIASDTVGFVSNLPHELVAAFRATLEEVLEADVLLHVRDIASEDSAAQKADVEKVLLHLFEADALPSHMIEVWNKVDLLPAAIEGGEEIKLSAVTGEGIDALLKRIEQELSTRFFTEMDVHLTHADGAKRAWLHRHGQVVKEEVEEEGIHLTVRLPQEHVGKLNNIRLT